MPEEIKVSNVSYKISVNTPTYKIGINNPIYKIGVSMPTYSIGINTPIYKIGISNGVIIQGGGTSDHSELDTDSLVFLDSAHTGTPLRLFGTDASGNAKEYDIGGSTDEKTKISSNDTTAGYLENKVVVDSTITKTTLNDGSNETLQLKINPTIITAIGLNTTHRGLTNNPHDTALEASRLIDNKFYGDVDYNSSSILNISTVGFDTSYTPTGSEPIGTSYYDSDNDTMSTVLPNGVIGQWFEEDFIAGQNDTGDTLIDGCVATYAGSIGNSGNIRIAHTVASKDESPIMTIGLITHDIINGANGKVTTRGKVRGIQTDGANYSETWIAGEILYKSSTIAGGLTNVAPQAPIPAIPLAVVISAHASNGTLLVRPTFPTSITMLTDVDGEPLTTSGQIMVWDSAREVFDFTDNINNYTLLTAFNSHADRHEIGGGDLVNHNNLTNFVANKHIDHSAVTITGAGDLLTGQGGDITASRVFTLDNSDVDHTKISGRGTNAHTVIDIHLASTSNPHGVGLEQARTVNNTFAGDVDLTGGDYHVGGVGLSDTGVGVSGSSLIGIPTDGGTPTVNQLQLYLDNIGSTGFFSGGEITDAGAGTIDIAAGEGLIRATDDDNAPLLSFTWDAETSVAVTDDTTQYVYINYNGGSPVSSQSTSEFEENNTKILIGVATKESGAIESTFALGVRLEESIGAAGRFIRDVHGVTRNNRLGGLIFDETGTRNLTLSAGELLWGRTVYPVSALDTSVSGDFDIYYRDAGAGFTKVTGSTQWPNAQYDDGSGTLVTMNNNRWGVMWLYIEPDNHEIMVYGRNQHVTMASAENQPAPNTLPPRLANTSVLAGRIIFQKSAATGTFESSFDIQFNSLGVTDHGNLSGNEDDDHTQYWIAGTLRAGNFSTSGTLTASNLTGTNTGDITVTDSAEIDFTLTGQDLTASLIAGSIDVLKLDSGVQTSLGLADSSTQPADLAALETIDLDDVSTDSASKNDVLMHNGTEYVPVPEGTTFTFSINTFVDNQSSEQEIGVGEFLAIGGTTFTASYVNPPATSGTVQIVSGVSAWASPLDMGSPYTGPTASLEAVPYPSGAGTVIRFRLTATDGVDPDTKDVTITLNNRNYWGVSTTSSGYTEADIEGLANNDLTNTRSRSFTVTAGAGEYIIYSYPTRMGTATFTVGGFEGGFESPETVSVTNSSGFEEDYYVYRSTNVNLGSTTVVVT